MRSFYPSSVEAAPVVSVQVISRPKMKGKEKRMKEKAKERKRQKKREKERRKEPRERERVIKEESISM